MADNLEDKYRILALKKAAIVMNGLADSFKDESVKQETKSLAWAISWAVARIEPIPFKSGDTHCSDCPCRYGNHLRKPEQENL